MKNKLKTIFLIILIIFSVFIFSNLFSELITRNFKKINVDNQISDNKSYTSKDVILDDKKYDNEIKNDFKPKCIYNVPQFIEGCSGEGCGFLAYDKSIKPAIIYKEPSKSSMIVDQLKKCELIKDFKVYMWIEKFGEAKILLPNLFIDKVNKGDIVKLKYYSGEGYYSACTKDYEITVGDELNEDTKYPSAEIISGPKTEGWVSLTTPRGINGYTPDSDFYINNYTYDYRDEPYCN